MAQFADGRERIIDLPAPVAAMHMGHDPPADRSRRRGSERFDAIAHNEHDVRLQPSKDLRKTADRLTRGNSPVGRSPRNNSVQPRNCIDGMAARAIQVHPRRVLGDPDLVEACRRRQPGWSVNGVASAACPNSSTRSISPPGRWRSPTPSSIGLGVAVPWAIAPTLRCQLGPGRPGRVARAPRPPRHLGPRLFEFGMPEVARMAVPDADGLDRLAAALDRMDLDPGPEP